jgi:N6-adenosine-specific RNA methylase IME4
MATARQLCVETFLIIILSRMFVRVADMDKERHNGLTLRNNNEDMVKQAIEIWGTLY